MALMKFMISGHQAFKNDKSMLRRLYGETTAFVEKNKTEADQDSLGDSPRTAFKKSLEERREFKVNYYCFTLISIFKALCCCLIPCCKQNKGGWCRRQLESHTKFMIA